MKNKQMIFAALMSVLVISCGKVKMSGQGEKKGQGEDASQASGEKVETSFTLPAITNTEVENQASMSLAQSSDADEKEVPQKGGDVKPMAPPPSTLDERVQIVGQCVKKSEAAIKDGVVGKYILSVQVVVPEVVAALKLKSESGETVAPGGKDGDQPIMIPKDNKHLHGILAKADITIGTDCSLFSLKINGLLIDHSYQLFAKLSVLGSNGLSRPLYKGVSNIFHPSSEKIVLKMSKVTKANQDVDVQFEEDGKPVSCTKEYAPVCGEEKTFCAQDSCIVLKTFSNKCLLAAAGAKFSYAGECKPKSEPIAVCNEIYAPVCGNVIQCVKVADGQVGGCNPVAKTFSSLCHLKAAKGEFLHNGVCK